MQRKCFHYYLDIFFLKMFLNVIIGVSYYWFEGVIIGVKLCSTCMPFFTFFCNLSI